MGGRGGGRSRYLVMCGTALSSAVAPMLEIFLPAEEFPADCTDWLLPQLIASATWHPGTLFPVLG